MNFKGIYYSLTFRLALAIGLTAALTYLALVEEWGWFLFLGIGWMAALRGISLLFKRNAQKVAFMFDAIDNSDYAFKYATRGRSSNDKLVSESLNRITQILFQAKAEAIQKEKYYELIMNQVNTGIIVEDDKGNIYQTINEALRLLGLTVFTHARQLGRMMPPVSSDQLLAAARIRTRIRGDKHAILAHTVYCVLHRRIVLNLEGMISERMQLTQRDFLHLFPLGIFTAFFGRKQFID